MHYKGGCWYFVVMESSYFCGVTFDARCLVSGKWVVFPRNIFFFFVVERNTDCASRHFCPLDWTLPQTTCRCMPCLSPPLCLEFVMH